MTQIFVKLQDAWKEVVAFDLDGNVVVMGQDSVERIDPREIEGEYIHDDPEPHAA